MAVAPSYNGGVAPAVGAGTQGAGFQPLNAPLADITTPLVGAYNRYAQTVSKEQEAAEDALFTSREVELRKFLYDQKFNQDSGFLNLHGENALKPDDNGAGLSDRVLKGASDFRDELMAGWSSRQKDAFRRRTDTLLTNQYGLAAEHVNKEGNDFRISQSSALVDAAAANAETSFSDPNAVQDAFDVAQRESEKMADFNGLTGEAKDGYIRNAKGAVLARIIGSAVSAANDDDQAIFTAQGIMDKYGKDVPPAKLVELKARMKDKFDSVYTGKKADELWGQIKQGQAQFALGGSFFSAGADGKATLNAGAMDVKNVTTIDQARGVADTLASAVGFVESGNRQFETDGAGKQKVITSPKKAYGIMQLTESAIQDVAEKVYGRKYTTADLDAIQKSPELNQQFGKDYLAYLITQTDTVQEALAAYNGGIGKVKDAKKKWGADWLSHMPPETQSYVPKVLARLQSGQLQDYKRADGSSISALKNPREYATQFYREVSRDQVKEWLRHGDPRLAASESLLDRATDAVMARQKADQDGFATNQTNITSALLEEYAQTGAVNQDLLRQLTLKGQMEFKAYVKNMDAGDTSGDLQLLARLMLNPADVFMNKATSKPITPEEANIIIKSLPKGEQDKWQLGYQKFVQQFEMSKNASDSAQAMTEAGNINMDFYQGTPQKVIDTMKFYDPEGFGQLEPDQQQPLALAAMWALAERGQLSGAPVKSDSPEFHRIIREILHKDIDVKSFWRFLPFTSNTTTASLMDVDLGDMSYLTPTSAGSVFNSMANAWVQARYGTKRSATDNERREFFLRFMLMKNPGINIDRFTLDSSVTEHINEEYRKDFKKANGRDPLPGEMPTKLDVFKEYFLSDIKGDSWTRKGAPDNVRRRFEIGDEYANRQPMPEGF